MRARKNQIKMNRTVRIAVVRILLHNNQIILHQRQSRTSQRRRRSRRVRVRKTNRPQRTTIALRVNMKMRTVTKKNTRRSRKMIRRVKSQKKRNDRPAHRLSFLFMDTKMKLYGDVESQGTRAVLALLAISKIPYDFVKVSLDSFETRSKAFTELNPFSHIPFLVDGDLKFGESSAILRYIC